MACTVTMQLVAVNVWAFRGHPEAGRQYGDPGWVAGCVVRAERHVGDSDVYALALGSPKRGRPVAHVFLGLGKFSTEAHREFERILLGMGFRVRYQERSLGSGRYKVKIVDLITRRRETRIMSSDTGDCGGLCGGPAPMNAGPQATAILGMDWDKVKEGARRLLPFARSIAAMTSNTYDDAFVAFVEALLAAQS